MGMLGVPWYAEEMEPRERVEGRRGWLPFLDVEGGGCKARMWPRGELWWTGEVLTSEKREEHGSGNCMGEGRVWVRRFKIRSIRGVA